MKWIKHMVNASQDFFIMDLEAEFGDAGYAFWFKTLELLGAQGKQGSMIISETAWRQTIASHRTDHLRRLYTFASARDKLSIEDLGNGLLRVTCKKLNEYADEYTQRVTANREKVPIVSGQSAPRIEEEQKEKKKEKKHTVFVPPTEQEVVDYFALNGYQESIARRAFKGYSEGNWHDSHGKPVRSWKQKMVNVWFKDEYKIKETQKSRLDAKSGPGHQIRKDEPPWL
jgi:hypothetical protein